MDGGAGEEEVASIEFKDEFIGVYHNKFRITNKYPPIFVWRVGSVILSKFCSHSQVSKESLSPSIHIGGNDPVSCL